MQLRKITPDEAYKMHRNGEKVYIKIFGIDTAEVNAKSYDWDYFYGGYFTFFKTVELDKIETPELIARTSKSDMDWILTQEYRVEFGWLELSFLDGKRVEINFNELKKQLKGED